MTEINSMKDSTNSERAVNLNSTTGTKSSTANSKKAKAQPKSQSSGNKSSSTKTNVLSGRSMIYPASLIVFNLEQEDKEWQLFIWLMVRREELVSLL